MNDDEKYLFDLNGYLVINDVLTGEEINQANTILDRRLDQGRIRPREQSLSGESPALEGEHGRGELSGLVNWDEPDSLLFRDLLAHPRLVPYLNEMLGPGFRMDHQMFLLWMDKGAEGFRFHGSSGPGFDPNQYYIFKNGKMHNGLTVVTYQLTDVNPGSHKSNYPCPPDMKLYLKHQEHIRQVTCRAGDVVIFSEATTHGTLPWTANHPRRSLLTRYTAGNMAYVRPNELPQWANERQRAVMEPPYHTRLNRPTLEE